MSVRSLISISMAEPSRNTPRASPVVLERAGCCAAALVLNAPASTVASARVRTVFLIGFLVSRSDGGIGKMMLGGQPRFVSLLLRGVERTGDGSRATRPAGARGAPFL